MALPQLVAWGPRVASLQVLAVTHNRMPAHAWAVFATWSNTGRTWSTPTALHSDITADGESVQDVYSTPANFAGRRLKLLLGCHNITGSVRNEALVCAWVVVTFKT